MFQGKRLFNHILIGLSLGAISASASATVKISGEIENLSYVFHAQSMKDAMEQCQKFHNVEKPQLVDDISVSINDGAKIDLRNGPGYWRTANDVCGQIIGQLQDKDFLGEVVDTGPIGNLLVKGRVESTDFSFSAGNIDGIHSQCTSFHSQMGITRYVDDIYVTVNNMEEVHLRNGPGYWGTAGEVCEQISGHLRKLDLDVPPVDPGTPPPVVNECGSHFPGEYWEELVGEHRVELNCPLRRESVYEVYKKYNEYTCDREGENKYKTATGEVFLDDEPLRIEGRCSMVGKGNHPQTVVQSGLQGNLYRPICRKGENLNFAGGYKFQGVDPRTNTQMFKAVINVTNSHLCNKQKFFGPPLHERKNYTVEINFRAVGAKIDKDGSYVSSRMIDPASFTCEKTSGDRHNEAFSNRYEGNCNMDPALVSSALKLYNGLDQIGMRGGRHDGPGHRRDRRGGGRR